MYHLKWVEARPSRWWAKAVLGNQLPPCLYWVYCPTRARGTRAAAFNFTTRSFLVPVMLRFAKYEATASA